MTSPFAILFLAIQQRLATIVDNNSAPIFTFIEQDLGQLEDNTKGINRPPVSWPCALIDIDDSNFQNTGENGQTGVVNVYIRIGFPPFSSTALSTPEAYKNKALYYYDLEQAIFTTFHGWNPTTVNIVGSTTADLSDIFGHFIRVRAMKEERNDLLRVRTIIFTVSMSDHSAEDSVTMVPVGYTINTGIHIP